MWMVFELRLLPPLARRALALGLVLVLLSGLAAVLTWPFLSSQVQSAAELEQRYALLSRYNSIADYADRLGELKGLAADETARAAFYPDRDSGIVSAELQGRVAAAVASSGAALRSTRPVSVEPSTHLSWVGVEARLIGALPDVQEALVNIERGQPLLFVRGAHFRAPHGGQFEENGNRAVVEVSLDIHAAIWREPKK